MAVEEAQGVAFQLLGAVGGGVLVEHPGAGPLPEGAALVLGDLAQVLEHLAGVRAVRISSPILKKVPRPGHSSLMIGVAQAAASNRRTLGEKPAATMSARVTFRVKRCWL